MVYENKDVQKDKEDIADEEKGNGWEMFEEKETIQRFDTTVRAWGQIPLVALNQRESDNRKENNGGTKGVKRVLSF